jgi:hypothetical protein
VIEPVAEQINPEGIRDRACELYLQLLGQQLPAIISRYNAPPEQFSQRLNRIPPSPWATGCAQCQPVSVAAGQVAGPATGLASHAPALHQQASKGPGRPMSG